MGAGANTFSLRRVVLWVVFALGTRIVLKLRLNLRDTRFYTLTGSLILSQFPFRAVYPNHLQLPPYPVRIKSQAETSLRPAHLG